MEECMNDVIARNWLDLYTHRADPLHIYFILVQNPYWLYLDYGTKKYRVAELTESEFCFNVMKRCQFLEKHLHSFEETFNEFSRYRRMVPTYGAVLLNKEMTKLILVTSYKHSSKSFPKGKINEGETEVQCAIREVHEEIGIDITDAINDQEYLFIEGVDEKFIKLFIINSLSESVQMKPTVSYEIEEIKFYSIDELERRCQGKEKAFGQVSEYLGAIKKWVCKKRKGDRLVKLEITLSHEDDKEICALVDRNALFHRGLYSQFVKKNYAKAKEYYKNAILTLVKPRHAVECWLNKMITFHEPLLSSLHFLKKHKKFWLSKLGDYKLIKANIRKAYVRKPKGLLNLLEIYDIDKKKIRHPWESTQLFIRRLLKYDASILRVHTFYETKGTIPQKNARSYTTTRSRAKNSIHVAELAHDAATCKVAKRSNLPFFFDMVAADNVKVNNEKYYDWVAKSEPQLGVVRESEEWADQVAAAVESKMLKDVDFELPDDYEENELDSGELEKKGTQEFRIEVWDNFHIDI